MIEKTFIIKLVLYDQGHEMVSVDIVTSDDLQEMHRVFHETELTAFRGDKNDQ